MEDSFAYRFAAGGRISMSLYAFIMSIVPSSCSHCSREAQVESQFIPCCSQKKLQTLTVTMNSSSSCFSTVMHGFATTSLRRARRLPKSLINIPLPHVTEPCNLPSAGKGDPTNAGLSSACIVSIKMKPASQYIAWVSRGHLGLIIYYL